MDDSNANIASRIVALVDSRESRLRCDAVVPAPASAAANRVYSPGVDTGDYLYVSGQGPRRPDGSLPATFEAQVRQALDNVKSVVQAAGLTMEHVVYTQVYLEDISKYREVNQVFAEVFAKAPPARAVLGVAKLPEPSVQINAVAVRNLADRRAIYPPNYKSDESASPAILTHDRLFLSAMPGSDPSSGKVPDDPAAQVDFALDRMKAVLEAAGLDLGHMVFVNPYLTADIPMRVMNQRYALRFEFGNTPARATIEVSSLPGRRSHRIHRRRSTRSETEASRSAQEHASQPNRESVRLCRRYFVLLRQEWFHSRTARWRLCLHHSPPTPANHAKSARQPRRS